MFRFLFVGLAFFALGALLFGAPGAAAVVGAFLLFKILFLVVVIGFLAGMWRRKGGPGTWDGPWYHTPHRSEERPATSRKEQFEEWHRLAHAKDEVDSWVDGIE